MGHSFKICPEVEPRGCNDFPVLSELYCAGKNISRYFQKFNRFFQACVMMEIIICMKKNDVIPGCKRDTLIHCIGDPFIFFRNDVVYCILVFLNNAQRSICRSAIDNNVFNVFIGLIQYTLNGLLKIYFSVERYSDYADQR